MSGLKAVGLSPELRTPTTMNRDTVLVIWNRYSHWHDIALQVEKHGGRVWVAENGYIGKKGVAPKFDVHPAGPKPDSYYAIAEGYHNGGGTWSVGAEKRWPALNVELQSWRKQGDHILVCPNRSFGIEGRAMHPDWAARCAARLRAQTKRPVVIRSHPGNDRPKRDLVVDLKNAWACVVWSSGAGVHSLIAGIPTFCEAPFWILKSAAATGSVDDPVVADREAALERMCHAQWTCEEIARGEPFSRLLRPAG